MQGNEKGYFYEYYQYSDGKMGAPLAFVRESIGARWIPSQMASNAENVSIWWRHHETNQYWI